MSTPDSATALPPPKTLRGERTRARILDAAQAEIGGRGFSVTGIGDIARAAGVAQGTFYVYFRSKEDVLRDLVLRMGRRLRRHLSEATAGLTDRLEIERRGFHAFLHFVRDNPDLYRVVAESQFVDEAAHRRYYEDFAAGYRAVLEAAAADDDIAPGDAEVRAWALMGVCDMVGRRFALWDREADVDAAAEEAWSLVADGLSPRREAAP